MINSDPAGPGGPEAAAAARLLRELAIEAAGVGTFDWDLRSGVLVWDSRLLEQFGYDESTFTRSIEAFEAGVHPGDRARVNEALDGCVASGGGYEAEYRVVRPDGTIRWISARGHAVVGLDGLTARVVGATLDVTDIRAGEARVAGVLEEMSAAFYFLDREWRFTYVNAEAERLLGRRRGELLGQSVWELFPATRGSDFETYYFGAARTGEPVSFEAYYPAPLDGWYEIRVHPGSDGLSVYFLDISERRRAGELREAVQRRSELVARVTGELAEHLDAEHAVARLARLLVPELADWCLVTLVDDHEGHRERRNLRDVGWWHVDPAQRSLVEEYARSRLSVVERHSFLMRALETGQVQVIEDATAAIQAVLREGSVAEVLGQLAPQHSVILPLRARGRTVGLLSLFRGRERGALTTPDLHTTAEVAGRAGLALDNSRLYRQQLTLAEGLQRALLTEPPTVSFAEIFTRYLPAGEAAEVGGDWYDAFVQDDGRLVVVIGDVVGHDIDAAATMGQLRSAVRTLGAAQALAPHEVLSQVDGVMETLGIDTTASAVVARLSRRQNGCVEAEWSAAGHPPPLVKRAGGETEYLESPSPDLLLGVHPGLPRRSGLTTLAPGDLLLLYTDGLVERRGESITAGLERLASASRRLGDEGSSTALQFGEDLIDLMLPTLPGDDVAVLVVGVPVEIAVLQPSP